MEPKYGTSEWREWQKKVEAEEVAARPKTNNVRRALTPAEFESYRPKQLVDLFDKEAEQKSLQARNTRNDNDGITIKFLADVPGYSAGEVATIATPQAREYLKEKQAEIAR